MMEILAASIDKAFTDLNINAKKTYESKTKHCEYEDYEETYQVWELSDEDFEKLCSVKDEDWHDDWGWWRSAKGSNMFGNDIRRYNINNHYLLAWDGDHREDEEKDNKEIPIDERYITPRKYNSLTEYFCDEIGASLERNICALAVDLAKINNIKMSKLFEKYQG